MKLSEARPGQRLCVIGFGRLGRAQLKLMDLGIVPGVEIKLLSRFLLGGPLLLQVGRTHVAIGRRIADGILVEEVSGKD